MIKGSTFFRVTVASYYVEHILRHYNFIFVTNDASICVNIETIKIYNVPYETKL